MSKLLVRVRLDYSDLVVCFGDAEFRYWINVEHGRENKPYPISMNNGFNGAMGELSTSRYYNILRESARLPEEVWQKWRKCKPDVGPFEVRSTRDRNMGLKVYEKDLDKFFGILAWVESAPKWDCFSEGNGAVIRLVGWFKIGEAKRVEWWSDRLGCFVVPRNVLKDLRDWEGIRAACVGKGEPYRWDYE